MSATKDEILFQIEILYDFAEDTKNLDEMVVEKISKNFKISMSEAIQYVEEYKALRKQGLT